MLESLITLAISVTIILTLSYCVAEQFKIINNWETRTSAHKVMLLHAKYKNIPDTITIDDRDYKFSQMGNQMKVEVNGQTFYAQTSS